MKTELVCSISVKYTESLERMSNLPMQRCKGKYDMGIDNTISSKGIRTTSHALQGKRKAKELKGK